MCVYSPPRVLRSRSKTGSSCSSPKAVSRFSLEKRQDLKAAALESRHVCGDCEVLLVGHVLLRKKTASHREQDCRPGRLRCNSSLRWRRCFRQSLERRITSGLKAEERQGRIRSMGLVRTEHSSARPIQLLHTTGKSNHCGVDLSTPTHVL